MSLAISRHFAETLDAPLRNERWSWGSVSSLLGGLVLRVWDHERDGASIQIFKERDHDKRPGQIERRRHLDDMIAGMPALAVVCVAKDPDSEKREIRSYDRQNLVRLGAPWRRNDGLWFASITATLPVADLKRDAFGPETLEADLRGIEARDLAATTRRALIDARIGQGRFRTAMLAIWNERCAATGCSIVQALRASHAKPWRASTDSERLDPHNGLPLVATLDALFDSGLICFDARGDMLVSDRLSEAQRVEIGLPIRLRKKPGRKCAGYLHIHRQTVFR